jgi:pyruvate dehydrogenase (quinone)
VQIDIKPDKLNLRYPIDVPLHGDAKITLEALLARLERKSDRSWREKLEKKVSQWWELLKTRAKIEADPINPQWVFWELNRYLPDDCIIAADSGTSANWFARDLKVRPSMMASLSGGLATMCPGVPYALAAKFAYPSRPALALVGDGAMQMLGNNGLISVKHYWREWDDPRLIVCVLNNGDLNLVTWEQRVMSGDPKFDASQTLPEFSYAEYARQLGLEGIEVLKPDQIGSAWERAFSADRPTVIDAHTDPDVAPLPPHITFEQARKYMASIWGDSSTPGHLIQSVKGMVGSWMPGH